MIARARTNKLRRMLLVLASTRLRFPPSFFFLSNTKKKSITSFSIDTTISIYIQGRAKKKKSTERTHCLLLLSSPLAAWCLSFLIFSKSCALNTLVLSTRRCDGTFACHEANVHVVTMCGGIRTRIFRRGGGGRDGLDQTVGWVVFRERERGKVRKHSTKRERAPLTSLFSKAMNRIPLLGHTAWGGETRTAKTTGGNTPRVSRNKYDARVAFSPENNQERDKNKTRQVSSM